MFTSLPHILIVDDSPLNLEILSAALINEYEIETVQSGRQALALAQQLQPDVILLDVSMPEMDGFEVCQRLKQNPATAELPVIFLTSIESSESSNPSRSKSCVPVCATCWLCITPATPCNWHWAVPGWASGNGS